MSVARLSIALIGAMLITLVVWATPAFAAVGTTHPFSSSFDGSGTPQGSFSPNSDGGLAIDQSNGHVVIVSSKGQLPGSIILGSHVDIFDSTGGFLAQTSRPPVKDLEPAGIAIDNSGGPTKGRIYVANVESQQESEGVEVFDSTGNYLSRLDGSNTPAGFLHPRAVAVDSSGKIYVLQCGGCIGDHTGASVIEVFDSSGNYLSQLSGPHINSFIGSLAFDASDNLYAAEAGAGIVKFNSAGVFQFSFGTDRVDKLAVDPTSGDVYATEDRYIGQYDSAGNLLGRFGYEHFGAGVDGVGVHGASGKVYAIDHRAVQGNEVTFLIDVFGPGASATAPEATTGASSEVAYFDATLNGTVNPKGVPTAYHFEYRGLGDHFGSWASTPEQDVGSGEADVPVSGQLSGLKHKTGYEVRLVATNKAADLSTIAGTDSFTTLVVPAVEAATIDAASSITTTSAHLSGTLTLPAPGFPTTYQFQYSADGTNWTNGPSGSAGSGSGEAAVSGDLSGLLPNSQYFIRLSGENQGGGATSAQKTFTTKAAAPSQVETLPAGQVENTSVLLGGLVNPNHSATSYWFEYGSEDCASSSCTSLPESQDASAGSATSSTEVTQPLAGLEPNATYHYRILTKNSAGTVAGNDILFTTDDPNAPGPPDRGIELVNNPDKGNQPVTGGLASDGEHVIWTTFTGVPGSTGGSYGIFRASRSADGWHSENLLPPIDQILGDGTKAYFPEQFGHDGSSYLAGAQNFLTGGYIEYALVDSANHTQQVLGQMGFDFNSNQRKGLALADASLSQAYSLTYLPLLAGDVDDKFDLFAYDPDSGSWSLAGLRPGDVDPKCDVEILRPEEDLYAYPMTSSGAHGEKRVFFKTTPTDNCEEPKQLYVRDLIAGTTEAISTPALGGALGEATFVRATPSGDGALFLTSTKLAAADENGSKDLYLWREGEETQCLTCIVAEAKPDGVMASPDLSYVYFTSTEKTLVAGRGMSNPALSIYALHDGQLAYLGAEGSGNTKHFGNVRFYSETSADGSVALFQSNGATADGEYGGGRQIYRYDAENSEVQCVTCTADGSTGDLLEVNEGASSSPFAVHSLDTAGNDVVFLTSAAISPRDVNKAPDLYEWKNGRTRLITDGVTEFPTSATGRPVLNGISADGTNVLFRSPVQLTGYEQDHQSNLYVARAGGGFPPPARPPAPCVEDACQGPLQTPPGLSSSASTTYTGQGNERPARAKHKQKKRHHKKKRDKRAAKHSTRRAG